MQNSTGYRKHLNTVGLLMYWIFYIFLSRLFVGNTGYALLALWDRKESIPLLTDDNIFFKGVCICQFFFHHIQDLNKLCIEPFLMGFKTFFRTYSKIKALSQDRSPLYSMPLIIKKISLFHICKEFADIFFLHLWLHIWILIHICDVKGTIVGVFLS